MRGPHVPIFLINFQSKLWRRQKSQELNNATECEVQFVKLQQIFYQKFDIRSCPDSNPTKPCDDDASVLPLSYRIWPTGVKVEKPTVFLANPFPHLLTFSHAC